MGSAHIDEKACKKCLRRADSMKPENAMTPRLDCESKPDINDCKKAGEPYQLDFRQRSSCCCRFVKRANRRTVQDISGCLTSLGDRAVSRSSPGPIGTHVVRDRRASPYLVFRIATPFDDTGEQARSVNLLETWGLVSRRENGATRWLTVNIHSLGS